jgi:hypothetical protein
VLVGSEVRPVKTFDLVHIPPMTWHQFRTRGNEPMGFLCMVNAERDRPQLPNEEDLQRMRSDPRVAAFLGAELGCCPAQETALRRRISFRICSILKSLFPNGKG